MSSKVARLLFILALTLAACAPAAPTTAPVTQLTFTYWGSDMERAAVEGMVAAFEARNPDIRVQAIQIPYEGYLAQVTAMLKQGQPPDVGYFPGLQAPIWAQEGKLLDLTELVQSDPLFASSLPETRYYFGDGRIVGLNTAVEIALLFYNKDLFDAAGLPYPPADPAQAWTWEQFVATAKRLTADAQGKHPGDAGFDPAKIVTYGAAFDKIYEGWTFYPFIYSNGGEVVDDAGTRLLLDQPAAVEAVQALADLMWVHHAAPTPQTDANLPGYVTMLQTGNLAMHISGQWSLLDYASVSDLRFGVAVLPKFKQPMTVVLGSPTVIFADTKHREAAIRSAREGKMTLSSEAAQALIRASQQAQEFTEALTDREREVLKLMVEGLNNAEIAERLVVSLSTVKYHISNILGKLGVDNRVAAVTMAIQKKLV